MKMAHLAHHDFLTDLPPRAAGNMNSRCRELALAESGAALDLGDENAGDVYM